MHNRKDDHVELAKKMFQDDKPSDFDQIRFVYNSLSEISLDEIDLSSKINGLTLDFPFFINAMTGGSSNTKLINEKLARVAKGANIAIASGSLSAAIKDETLIESFSIIREVNNDGLVFANIGAEKSLNDAKLAIQILSADILQIHLNVIQELAMPEGDRNFKGWSDNIKHIVENVDVPVIVKEVGFGMSKKTIKSLYDLGVKNVDVSGFGGTNFASIENFRRRNSEFKSLETFGQSTVISLLEAQDYIEKIDIIASGGVRNPLDIIKALALGAKAVGLSGVILNMVETEGVEKTITTLNHWKKEMAVIMTVLGKKSIKELSHTDIIITRDVKDWCLARNIDYQFYANRDL